MSVRFEGCEVLHETDRALLVSVPDLVGPPVWIPKAAVHDDSECYAADHKGDLVVHDWLAEREGWL